MTLDRRKFVHGIAGLGLLGAATRVSARALPAPQPNIIYIMADDMGYADVGAYGHRHADTPNIDRIAQAGMLLTNGYANAAICSPTRVALLTGCYQQRFAFGLEEPYGPAAPGEPGILHDRPTIASALRKLGYRTALVGKWHLGEPPEHGPTQHGYDTSFGIIQGAADYFAHRVDLSGHAKVDGLYRNDSPVAVQGYLTDLFGDEAVRIIEAGDHQPLFLSLHFNAPHWPWEAPGDEAVSKSLKDIFHRDGGSLKTYAAMVRSMDTNIGKVLDALERQGMADNTLIVFTSDNGGERFSDTWPLTGVKGELLEGGIRVPLLVKWPGHIAPGSTSAQVMISMDFMPTFVAAADGAPVAGLDGLNLLDVLTGKTPAQDRTLFWRFKASEQAAVRQGDWKYLRLGGKEHLFNVSTDPRERADLKDRNPDKFAALKSAYAAWNATMLPYTPKSYSEQVKASYADRY